MGVVLEGPWERCLDVDEDDRPTLRLIVTAQSCDGCVFATFGPNGTYCTEFNEWIFDEAAAGADCPVFERVP